MPQSLFLSLSPSLLLSIQSSKASCQDCKSPSPLHTKYSQKHTSTHMHKPSSELICDSIQDLANDVQGIHRCCGKKSREMKQSKTTLHKMGYSWFEFLQHASWSQSLCYNQTDVSSIHMANRLIILSWAEYTEEDRKREKQKINLIPTFLIVDLIQYAFSENKFSEKTTYLQVSWEEISFHDLTTSITKYVLCDSVVLMQHRNSFVYLDEMAKGQYSVSEVGISPKTFHMSTKKIKYSSLKVHYLGFRQIF